MSIIDPNQWNPDIPVCEKHNFKGYNCPMCRAEEIRELEVLKIAGIELSQKLEALLIACEVTEIKSLLPFLFNDAKKSLEYFKKLITEK